MRDCARRVFSQSGRKVVYGATELEGMQQRYGVINIILRGAIARCGKVNCSQLLTNPMLMLLRRAVRGHQDEQDGRDEFFSAQSGCSGFYDAQQGTP
jgi:hypothetical protein